MMSKVDAFKEKLETYRGEDIPEDVIAKVSPYLDDIDFNYERMKTKSLAGKSINSYKICNMTDIMTHFITIIFEIIYIQLF